MSRSRDMAVTLNVRCLSGPTTGVQRFTQEIAKTQLGNTPLRSISPSPRWSRAFTGHLWEQLWVPHALRRTGGLLISPANTGPVFYPNQVAVIHDMATFDVPDAFTPLFAGWYRFLLRALLPRVKAVVTVSKFSRERIVRWIPEVEDRVHVVYNGALSSSGTMPSRSRPEANDYVAKFGEYALFVGTMDPRKNLRRLMEAWNVVGADVRGKLLIVGGRNAKVFSDRRPHSGARDVLFIGRVGDAELKDLYHHARLVICPSIYEGFGLPALEAIAAGCRRIAVSDIGVFREVLGMHADYFDPLDVGAIARGIKSAWMGRENVSDAGARQLLGKFSWDRTRAEFASVLFRTMANGCLAN